MTEPNTPFWITKAEDLLPFHINPATENVACPCCGKLKVARPVAVLFAAVRKRLGRPLAVTSVCRCEAHQARLARGGGIVAKNPKTATHVLGFALDIGVATKREKQVLRDLLMAESERLWGRRARVGWIGYADGCIHFDLAWMAKPPVDPVNHIPGVEW